MREHNRKQRKEARNNPQQTRKRKDPGIPNNLPFKDKILAEVEQRKIQLEEERQQARLKRQMQARSLSALVSDAEKRQAEFQETQQSQPSTDSFVVREWQDGTASGTRDNSRRAYYREFRKVVEQSDVILEILDARDPLGCRVRAVEEMILSSGRSKRIILVLNKIDLVPREVVEQWLKYLRKEFPAIAFKASTQTQRTHLGQATMNHVGSDRALVTNECLGADTLIQLLKNYSRNANIKTALTIGVIGFPNVGKSSVINSLKRSKVCGVGNTPGFTKATQEISLDKNLKLLDCPGIVFSQSESNSAESVLRNCIKVELLEDPIAPVSVILERCGMAEIMRIYGTPPFASTQDFLIHLARQRGRLRRGGVADTAAAARMVLQDWNNGKIPYYTVPPKSTGDVMNADTAIVSQWSDEFKLDDAVMSKEAQDLAQVRTKEDLNMRMVTVNSIQVDADLDAVPDYGDDVMSTIEEEDEEDSEQEPELMMEESDEDSAAASSDDAEPESEMVTPGSADYKLPPSAKYRGGNKSKIALKPQEIMSVQESELNPQRNKRMKQQLKKLKKQKARSADAYDFEQDFDMD